MWRRLTGGRMTKSSFLALATAGVFLCLPAWAQGHEEGHAEYHDVYREWKQPSNGMPCCNEKKGNVGDCYPTDAKLGPAGPMNPGITGQVWYAKRDTGGWVEIPEGKIVREKNPDQTGSRAHLCIFDWAEIPLCFVPPTGGS